MSLLQTLETLICITSALQRLGSEYSLRFSFERWWVDLRVVELLNQNNFCSVWIERKNNTLITLSLMFTAFFDTTSVIQSGLSIVPG